MYSKNPFDSKDLPYQRKRYTIAELLVMRYTLPYVCCPVKSFKPEAWSERILINVPAGSFLDLDEKHRAKILASRLDLHRRNELASRLQKQDSLITRKKHPNRGTPPKPRVMPTIPEIPSLPGTPVSAVATSGSPIQPVLLDNGLFGGYGKAIGAVTPNNNGLIASMHAFVPGGTLKTAPVTAIDAGDGGKWSTKEAPAIRRTSSTLSLADGLRFKDTPVAAAPIDTVITRMGVTVASGVENTKIGAAANRTVNIMAEIEPPLVKPKALMAKRSSSNDQLAWIQFMMKKPIVSASQKAPQIKEALGATVDEPEDIEVFKVFGELDQLKATAGKAW